MNNVYFGVITILFCLFGYWFAYNKFIQNNYILSLILIVLCGLSLRIFTGTDFFLHVWDERYHALVAKNLIQHPFIPTLYETPAFPYDYREWCSNHIWLHKQPIPLWSMALSMMVFGKNEIALRLPTIIISTLGIVLIYYIAASLFNRKIGILSAFLFSIHGLIIELTAGRIATDHIDVFFLFFIELAVFLSLVFIKTKNHWWNFFSGISIGLAVLSKWLPAFIVLPIWVLLVYNSGKFIKKEIILGFLILFGAGILTFLPWQLYIFHSFPLEARYVQQHNFRHIIEALDGHSGSFFYHFNKLRINYGEIVYLPVLWFLFKLIKNPKSLNRLTIFIWFLLPYLFFSFCKTKMQGYTLFAAPPIFIMISAFFWHLQKNRKYNWIRLPIMALLIILPIRFAIERIKPFSKIERSPVWVENLKLLKKTEPIEKTILFNTKKDIEAMFYTEFTAYSFYPTAEQIRYLRNNGSRILICTNDSIQSFKEIN